MLLCLVHVALATPPAPAPAVMRFDPIDVGGEVHSPDNPVVLVGVSAESIAPALAHQELYVPDISDPSAAPQAP